MARRHDAAGGQIQNRVQLWAGDAPQAGGCVVGAGSGRKVNLDALLRALKHGRREGRSRGSSAVCGHAVYRCGAASAAKLTKPECKLHQSSYVACWTADLIGYARILSAGLLHALQSLQKSTDHFAMRLWPNMIAHISSNATLHHSNNIACTQRCYLVCHMHVHKTAPDTSRHKRAQ